MSPSPRTVSSSHARHRQRRGLTLVSGIGLLAVSLPLGAAGWDCHQDGHGKWVCEGAPGATTHAITPPRVVPEATLPLAPQTPQMPAKAPTLESAPRNPAQARSTPQVTAPPSEAVAPAATPPQPAQAPTELPKPAALPEEPETVPTEAAMPAATTPAEAPVAPEATSAEESDTQAQGPIPPASKAAIAALDEGLPWQACRPPAAPPQNQAGGTLPIQAAADSLEGAETEHRLRLAGDVELQQGDQYLSAEQVEYDKTTGQLQAQGDVLLRRPDLRLAADAVEYNLQTRAGRATAAEYRLPTMLARGTAAQAELVNPAHSHFSQITYTTCPPGDNAWELRAGELNIDTAEGLGVARHATVALGGVPVLYTPYLSFPIDDRRRSGLLIPSLGYGDRHGVDLSLPYYFNLAPNYDFTLTPRIMSKRGVMLGGEFRFLTTRHQGVIEGNFLPHDRAALPGDERRGSLSIKTQSQYNAHLSSSLDLNYVSDDNFLRDFGVDFESHSYTYVERTANLRYQAQTWAAWAQLEHFQIIDPSIAVADRPYAALPRLTFSAADQIHASFPARYDLRTEFAAFHKADAPIEGRRLDLYPRLEFPKRTQWYHWVPGVGIRYTRYQLTGQTAGIDASPDRLLPVLDLDTGLYFDRDTSWFGQAATQSLEPRLYFLYVPYKKQTDIPVFDTVERDLYFDSLFEDNRFSGADRVGDAKQVTLAVTSRIYSDRTGDELFSGRLGQILYLGDRKVQLAANTPADTARTSPLLAEVGARLSREWKLRGELAWDPDTNTTERALARASYRADRSHIFSAAYRQRNTTSSETDLGLIWPIGPRTRAIARWNYSLSDARNLDALAGIEYGTCCWKLRTLVRQQVRGTGSSQDLSFLVQLELRGLGTLGDNIDALLNEGIYGYRKEDD